MAFKLITPKFVYFFHLFIRNIDLLLKLYNQSLFKLLVILFNILLIFKLGFYITFYVRDVALRDLSIENLIARRSEEEDTTFRRLKFHVYIFTFNLKTVLQYFV